MIRQNMVQSVQSASVTLTEALLSGGIGDNICVAWGVKMSLDVCWLASSTAPTLREQSSLTNPLVVTVPDAGFETGSVHGVPCSSPSPNAPIYT